MFIDMYCTNLNGVIYYLLNWLVFFHFGNIFVAFIAFLDELS